MEQFIAAVAMFVANIGAALASPAVGGVIIVMTGLLLADFLTAITSAFRDETPENDKFNAALLPAFLRTHIIGQWVPTIGLVVLATFTPPLAVVAALAVTAYTVATVASIRDNMRLPKAA